jgi:hypothetical protein
VVGDASRVEIAGADVRLRGFLGFLSLVTARPP